MDNALMISDYNTLLTLHKTIIEAKFSDNPIHAELPGSPLLAQVANKIIEILIEKESELGIQDSSLRWKTWREIDKTRREWHVAVSYIRYHEQVWRTWTRSQKEEFVRILLSPYIISSEALDSLILETETDSDNNPAP